MANKYRRYVFSGTYSCGHEGDVYQGGYTEEYAQDIANREFEYLCPECKKIEKEKQYEKTYKELSKEAEEQGLPELDGTEKQVRWATTIRDEFLQVLGKLPKLSDSKINENAEQFTKEGYDKRFKELAKEYNEMVDAISAFIEQQSAKKFIDNRYLLKYTAISHEDEEVGRRWEKATRILLREYEKIVEEYRPKSIEEQQYEKEQEELTSKLTVFPENYNNTPIIIISYDSDKSIVMVKTFKDRTVIDLCKENGYRWGGSYWRKRIDNFTGSEIDRMAQIGNSLLEEGYAVEFDNEESKKMAITASFEKEVTSWIAWNEKEKKASLFWRGSNDGLYHQAKKISGAKWKDGRFLIPIAKHAELIEFAEIMGLGISDVFLEEVEKFKQEVLKKTVKVTAVEEEEETDKLKEILNSSTDVLDDLKDED